MDPLSIAASSFGIVGAIAKASIAILEFSQQAKDAAEDLHDMSRELQALSAILYPLARNVSRAPQGTVPAALYQQLVSSLDGCALVVTRIDTAVEKYQKDGAWTRTKWVMFGRGYVEKLRGSLEAYKMALSLGLHVVSMAVEASIKDDTGAIRSDTQALRHDTAEIQVNTGEILARVMSIRNGAVAEESSRTRQWLDSMVVLSSYAESSYQDTIIDLGEEDFTANDAVVDTKVVRGEAPALDPIPEFDSLKLSGEEETVFRTNLGSSFNGNTTRGATGTSVTVPVLQRHIETNDPVEASSALDTSDILRAPLESRKETDATSHNVARTTVQPTTIKNGTLNGTLDVVVALDIGGASAAVAWMAQSTPARVIREWPGGKGTRVPMRVEYDEKSESENAVRWGFQCFGGTGKRTWYFDHPFTVFMHQLYAYIRQTIVANMHLKLSDWAKLGVEFHVTAEDLPPGSTPQTQFHQMEKLKDQIRKSGIGTGGPHHCAVFGLTKTKAEAASVLLCLPPSIFPRQTIMLKIGLGHATILLTERSQTVANIHFCYSFPTPEPSSYIKEVVSTWLESHPEICENLGPNGLGRLDQEYVYQDILHGSALRESYRLRFDGLPESFSHAAFDIKDGTIRLTRTQVEYIFNSLVHEISSIVTNALVDGRTKLQDAPMLRGIIALEAPDTPRYLAKCIMDGLEQNSDIAFSAYTAARRRNSDAVPDTTLDEGLGLSVTAAPLNRFGERTCAAVDGLLVYRNAWNLRPEPRIEFSWVSPPRVFATAQTYNFWKPYSDISTVHRTDESETDPWPHPAAPITQHWRVEDYRYHPCNLKSFSLDLYYTLDSEWRNTYPPDLAKLTKLCTVVWKLTSLDFQFRTWTRRWWGRAVKHGTLEFIIRLCMLQSSNTGPRFELLVPDRASKLPESVQWHCEPPFVVCPGKSEKE